MSRLKHRIESLYRKTFDGVVPQRPVEIEELTVLDASTVEMLLRTIHASEYGRYDAPWTTAQRLDLLNTLRRRLDLPPCTTLPDTWPAEDEEYEVLLETLLFGATQRQDAAGRSR
ncbi:hypothetical protein [Gemmatimonas sp.]